MQNDRTSPAEFFLETIDLSRATGDEYERRLATLLEEKYRDVPLDLVVAFTEPAATFALSYRAKLFPNTPVLIGLVERRLLDTVSLPHDAAVAFVALDTPATVRFALRAHPSARKLYVVSGVSRFDRGWLAIVRDDLRAFEKGLTITYDTDSTREALVQHVAALGPDTIVFYVSMTRDADGDPERPVDVLESLRAVATRADLRHGQFERRPRCRRRLAPGPRSSRARHGRAGGPDARGRASRPGHDAVGRGGRLARVAALRRSRPRSWRPGRSSRTGDATCGNAIGKD